MALHDDLFLTGVEWDVGSIFADELFDSIMTAGPRGSVFVTALRKRSLRQYLCVPVA